MAQSAGPGNWGTHYVSGARRQIGRTDAISQYQGHDCMLISELQGIPDIAEQARGRAL
jgi:hypothetical protein